MANRSIRKWFSRLSFRNKLLLVFMFSTLISLLFTDIIMHVLLTKVGESELQTNLNENTQFNHIQTSETIQALSKNVLSDFYRIQSYLSQLSQTYTLFTSDPSVYSSKPAATDISARYTSNYATKQYVPALYFLSNNLSLFHDDPFFDEIMVNIPPSQYDEIKRINIFYIHQNMASDIFAKTIPATNDFIIKSQGDILNRLTNVADSYGTLVSNYSDQLSKSDNNTQLVALRTKLTPPTHSGMTILLQIQIFASSVQKFLQNVYYFPSTNVFFVSINPQTNSYNIIASLKNQEINLQPFLDPGVRSTIIPNNTQIVSGAIGTFSSNPLDQYRSTTTDPKSQFRFVVVSNQQTSNQFFIFLNQFVNNKHKSVLWILYTWTIFILLLCCALAFVVGNNVFEQLHELAERTRYYINNPKSARKQQRTKKRVKFTGSIGQLINNLDKMIDIIQDNKKKMSENYSQFTFPLNICEREFQKKVGMIDYQIMDQAIQQLKKIQQQKKRAQESQQQTQKHQ